VLVFQISQILFRISRIIFWISKKRLNVNSACHTSRLYVFHTGRSMQIDEDFCYKHAKLNINSEKLEMCFSSYDRTHYMSNNANIRTGCSRKKNSQSLRHHNSAIVRHRLVQFSTKCPEINCLHDKHQCLDTTIKYSLFCSWQVNYTKTNLTTTS